MTAETLGTAVYGDLERDAAEESAANAIAKIIEEHKGTHEVFRRLGRVPLTRVQAETWDAVVDNQHVD